MFERIYMHMTTLLAAAYELRSRLFKALLWLLGIFFVMAPFQNDIFTRIATPIMTRLPLGSTLISKHVAGSFTTPLGRVNSPSVCLGDCTI